MLGRRALGDNRFFNGRIDEARIASVARSTAWMQTEYNNQSNPNGFFDVGVEESAW